MLVLVCCLMMRKIYMYWFIYWFIIFNLDLRRDTYEDYTFPLDAVSKVAKHLQGFDLHSLRNYAKRYGILKKINIVWFNFKMFFRIWISSWSLRWSWKWIAYRCKHTLSYNNWTGYSLWNNCNGINIFCYCINIFNWKCIKIRWCLKTHTCYT